MRSASLFAGFLVFIALTTPVGAQTYDDSLAVLEALGVALRGDARAVVQRFACHDGMHPCRTPAAVLPDPLLDALAARAGARLTNQDRASVPPCPWGWDKPPRAPGFLVGIARLTFRGDTVRVLVLRHCDNPPGGVHDIFGQDDEYTLVRDGDGVWTVRGQRMTRITWLPARPRTRRYADGGTIS